jgi:hypothetical protein
VEGWFFARKFGSGSGANTEGKSSFKYRIFGKGAFKTDFDRAI